MCSTDIVSQWFELRPPGWSPARIAMSSMDGSWHRAKKLKIPATIRHNPPQSAKLRQTIPDAAGRSAHPTVDWQRMINVQLTKNSEPRTTNYEPIHTDSVPETYRFWSDWVGALEKVAFLVLAGAFWCFLVLSCTLGWMDGTARPGHCLPQ